MIHWATEVTLAIQSLAVIAALLLHFFAFFFGAGFFFIIGFLGFFP
jgi:hypothetical protein